MKITSIRLKPSKKRPQPLKLAPHELRDLAEALECKLSRAGFITHVSVASSTSLRLSLGGSCFKINPEKLGYNARVGRFIDSPKGYKRTSTPTWEQRVAFNHILNDMLDSWKLQARCTARGFVIRSVNDGRVDSWHGSSAQFNGFGELLSEILPEHEARLQCESDRLEHEHRQKRLAEQRARRTQASQEVLS